VIRARGYKVHKLKAPFLTAGRGTQRRVPAGEGSGDAGRTRMADRGQREAGLGLEDKVAIVTGGGAVDDGIGNGPPGPVGIEGTGWDIGLRGALSLIG
jgi:hypothetical protein